MQNISINADDALTLIITFPLPSPCTATTRVLLVSSTTERAGTTVTGEGVKPAE